MYDAAVQNLIDELGRLPGVGPKSAQRIAFYMLNADSAEMEKLTTAINTVKRTVSFCEICGNVSEARVCSICRDDRRDPAMICVVEESKDVVAIERTRSFTGRYHVLGGAINPLAGLGPEQLRIRELVARLSDERIQELILAMDPNLEGEATSTYLSRLLVPLGIRVTRLASGLPVGGDLEYADEITLGRALEGRRVISEGNRTDGANPAEEFEEALEEEAEAESEKAQQAQAQQQPTKRWSGSMFDEIEVPGNSPASDSDTDAAPTKFTLEDEPEQGTLNEPLLEKELQEQDERRASYEEKLAELKKTPLRTPKPDVPPIPGATYVNPWT
ncbi:MAG: recombination mediator RecR [Rothia sp. (in: high G+C Gram-positive bacteria)]|nr:recombination mediator RecR [Rothia sp. (in: high G+C Gram-positive bacteria)]